MDHSMHKLDRHFNLPRVREVDHGRPFHWLQMGWSDLREHGFASIAYGVFFAAVGYLILAFAAPRPYLVTASISGFFLVGPILAAGLYEISRRSAAGQPAGLRDSLRGIAGNYESLLSIGIFLAIVMLGWERVSAVLFALLFTGEIAELGGFMRTVLFSGEHLGFAAIYLLAGFLFAGLVFCATVISVPMLMDRDTDMVTAMMTSLRAVSLNLRAMALWAALIVLLIGIGFATMMVGLVLLLPLLGHATWHAYRDLVE